MSLGLHNLRPGRGSRKKRKRVGRGNASGHGTYSTRGQKGQRSRSGGKSGLKIQGMKQRVQKIPKLRGFKSRNVSMEVINLRDLDSKFSEGDAVTPRAMFKVGLIKDIKGGVKVLGDGKLGKKLTVRANHFSRSAKDAIIDAGGEVELVTRSSETRNSE